MKDEKKIRFRRRLKGLMQNAMPGMITCREFDEFLFDYLEGELTEHQRTLFERHIRWCGECLQYLQEYELAVRLGKAVLRSSNDVVPDDVPEDLVEAVLKARDG